MADANHNETKVLEGFLNDILKDAEYDGMSALDWLEQGLCVDKFTLQLDKPELLKLVSKALVAIAVQQNNYSKTIENYELVNEKNVAIHKMVNIATNAALAKYDAVEKMVKTNQEKIKLLNFEPVRKKGTEANKTKAKANKAFILKTNSDLLVHVDWARKKLDERAEYIAKQCKTQVVKMANGKNYSESYIKKLITGK